MVHHVSVVTSVREMLQDAVLVSAKDVMGLLANVRYVSVIRVVVPVCAEDVMDLLASVKRTTVSVTSLAV